MDPLEEILAMYDPRFVAPGLEDPRRRLLQQQQQGGIASDVPQGGGYTGGSIFGPETALARLLPFLLGTPGQSITGWHPGVDIEMAQPVIDTSVGLAGVNAAPAATTGESINPGIENAAGGTVATPPATKPGTTTTAVASTAKTPNTYQPRPQSAAVGRRRAV